MISVYAIILAVLEMALFASITTRTWGRLYIAQLAFLAAFILLTLFSLISWTDKGTVKFLLQTLFLAAIANAVLLYLALPFSLGIILGLIIGLGGFVSTFLIEEKPKPKKLRRQTKQKKAEVEKQLGPMEEEPKVIIEEAPKRIAKRKARRRRRRKK